MHVRPAESEWALTVRVLSTKTQAIKRHRRRLPARRRGMITTSRLSPIRFRHHANANIPVIA
jgi:hypothetical protein